MSVRVKEEAATRMGVCAAGLQAAGEQLEAAVLRKEVPGAVLLAGCREETLLEVVAGFAVDLPDQQVPMQRDTLFDLASLTKVCATLPALLALVDDGEVLLSDPVSRFVPAYMEGQKRAVTLRHLLTHTAGLPAGDFLYHLSDLDARLARLPAIALATSPGTGVVYSDVGFMLLGIIIEKVSSMRLDHFVRERIYEPLGLTRTFFRELHEEAHNQWPQGYAATEMDQVSGRLSYATVHDENAFSLGGIAGHAGLFADAADVARYAQAWLEGGENAPRQWLSPAIRRLAVSCHTASLDGQRGLGWCLRKDAYDHMGDSFSAEAYGHTGFTGTSIAIDPLNGAWLVLLTNRVHYGRTCDPSRLRRLLHNRISACYQRT